MLVTSVAAFFECKAIIRTNYLGCQWIFVGRDHSPEITAYVYEVLYSQLLKCKKRYQDSLLPNMSKRQLGNLNCIGWVLAVAKTVEQFAKKPNVKTAKAIDEELNRITSGIRRSSASNFAIKTQRH